MQECDIEGVASHDGPESCGCIRKDAREALTGENAGRAIEPRNKQIQSADAVIVRATPDPATRRAGPGICAVQEPEHAWKLHAREPGEPTLVLRRRIAGPPREGPRPYGADE